jgi:hypothetical protein
MALLSILVGLSEIKPQYLQVRMPHQALQVENIHAGTARFLRF